MNCMKCGSEVEEGQLFCADCLAVMEKYPVKPGIAIQLPRRPESLPAKKPHPRRRQAPSPEEQIRTLKRRVRRLFVLWLITFILLGVAGFFTVKYLMMGEVLLPGQNYSTFTEDTLP